MRITNYGEGHKSKDITPPYPQVVQPIITQHMRANLTRSRRLGDIIMTFPLVNYLYKNGYEITYLSSPQYSEIFEYTCVPIQGHNIGTRTQKADINVKLDRGIYDTTISKVENFFKMAEINNASEQDKIPRIKVDEIPIDNNVIAMSLWAYDKNSTRSYDIGNMKDIFNNFGDYEFVALDKEARHCDITSNVNDMTGKTHSLRELIEQISRARLVISVDTGILHLASAMGKPSISIFGPTDPVFVAKHYPTVAIDAGYLNRKSNPLRKSLGVDIFNMYIDTQIDQFMVVPHETI